MSDTKFTPGPWVQNAMGELCGSNGERVVASGYLGLALGGGSEEREANANLLAAAPELYEILQAVCDFSDAFRDGELPSDPEAAELYRKSRAALAKARGQKLAA